MSLERPMIVNDASAVSLPHPSWPLMAVWATGLIVYPAWLLPVPYGERLAIFATLLAYVGATLVLHHRWLAAPAAASPPGDRPASPPWRRYWPAVVLVAIYVCLRARDLTLPISSGGDEDVNATLPLIPFELLQSGAAIVARLQSPALHVATWAVAIAAAALAMMFRSRWTRRIDRIPSLWLTIAVLSLVGAAGTMAFLVLGRVPYTPYIHRYPPLGKGVTLAAYLVVGVNEIAARLPALVFSILGAIFVMRAVALFCGREAAVVALGLALFMPAALYYSTLVYLDPLVLALMSASVFFFVRYLKDGSAADLGWAAVIAGVGYLVKQYTLMLVPVYAIAVVTRRAGRAERWFGVRMVALLVLMIAPWRVLETTVGAAVTDNPGRIGAFLVDALRLETSFRGISQWRDFRFTPGNWLSWEVSTRYFRNLPAQATWAVIILALVGVIIGLRKYRPLTLVAIGMFTVAYLLLASDYEIAVGYPRFTLLLFPAMAMMASLAWDGLMRQMSSPGFRAGASVALVAFVAAQAPLRADRAASWHGAERFVSLDTAFDRLSTALPAGGRVAAAAICCEPIRFYSTKHGLRTRVAWVPEPILDSSDTNRLAAWMREEGIDCVVVIRPAWFSSDAIATWASAELTRITSRSFPLIDALGRLPDTGSLDVQHFEEQNGEVLLVRVNRLAG